MDYDYISNFSSTDYIEDTYYSWIIYPHEIVYAVISFVSLCAHGVIIFTIISNKCMKTPTNIILLNIIILDALYIITSPANLMLPLHSIFSPDIYCITYDIETTLQTGVVMLFILISFNCTVRPKKYLIFIIGTWVITILLCLIFIVLCALDIWSFAAMLLTFFGFAALIVIHVICRIAYSKKYNICLFRLNLVSVYVICWIFSWICMLISMLSPDYSVMYMLSIISAAVGYSYGIINIFALAYFDKRFKMYLLQSIRCENDYADAEDMDVSNLQEEDQDLATESSQDRSTMNMI